MSGGLTVLLGIPVPSSDPLFLALVLAHIAFGPPAVVAGLVTMLSQKGGNAHIRAGGIYFWSLVGLCVTMTMLAVLRWAEDYHLFLLGALALFAASFGRYFIRRYWLRLHLAAMASSYILMLTAFYVDNGKNLPVWRELPRAAYWIVSAAVGVPITIYHLFHLPRLSTSKR